MLLDTLNGLRTLHEDFAAFVGSPAEREEFRGATGGSPEQYEEFIPGLRVEKSGTEACLRLAEDRWLELSGPREALEEFGEQLLVADDGNHTHWYGRPLSLIIEADDSWPGHAG